tara:strand:+ start:952 stop:2166 length:1215 start_codon:yes stop_codon:yes gene_type:complete
MHIFSKTLAVAAFAGASCLQPLFAQDQDTLRNKEGGKYYFTVQNEIEATSVKNQYRSGTCWSFSALSFFESELERMGKGEYDLSEMFVVRHTYSDKAEKYVRMHGNLNFGPGGAFHDVVYVWKNYGMVPETAYGGLEYGTEKHIHSELDGMMKGIVDAVIDNKTLSTAWHKAFDAALDSYLGELPETFEYKGKSYTPESYAKELGVNPDDYITLSSFTHHPFYEPFVLEVPDNWLGGEVYNVQLDEMVEVMNSALENGYGVAWAADVSEKGFSFRDGLAIVPENEDAIKRKGSDNEFFSDAGAEKIGNQFMSPGEEKEITPEMRQEAFDDYHTTDDHGMHIVGSVTDQNGTLYYIVKNSWGTGFDTGIDGYFFASEAYVKYKTMNIMLHKDALPKALKKKLNIK